MKAIYKREVKACFDSFIGWLFVAVVLFLIGLYVTAYNLAEGSPYISFALQSSIIIFMIGIPILTMRTLAEERKNKTDQMILTAPVSIWRIVLGKFLGLETVFAIPCAVICVYPLIMGRYGEVPYLESYVTVLGFFLFGSAAIAIGIFVSSLTESQVISAVVSVVLIFVGYIMPGLCYMISQGGNLLTKVLRVYDLATPFIDISNGNFTLNAVFYYLSVIFLFLFFTTQSIQKRRYSVSVKQLKRGAYSIVSIVLVSAIVISANILLAKVPEKYTKFDITQEKLFSLTDESYKMMDSLQEDITIYVLALKNNMKQDVIETLNRYEEYSEHIRVEYVDISSNPAFAKQYTDEAVTAASLIVAGEKRSKYIAYESLYVTELSYETFAYETTGYDAEGQITSALAYVTGDDMPKIYLLEGHGEAELEPSFLSAMEKLNIEYERFSLLTADKVPEDAECLIINAPEADLSESDTSKIRMYLQNGGNAMFIYGYMEEDLPHYLSLLQDYSVEFADGMVVEENRNYYYDNMLYLLPEIEYDDVTASIHEDYIFSPYSRGIIIKEQAEGETAVSYLLKTTEDSFSRVNPGENTSNEKTEDDISGPFALGVRAIRQTETGESTAMIFSSSLLFTEMADEVVAGSNKKLFTESLRSLLPVENSVSIPVKSYNMSLLTVPAMEFIIFGLVMVLAVPLALLITGFVIWLGRRKR